MISQLSFRALQALTRWALAVCWLVLTLLATALLLFGNFLVAWQAFDLLGFETQPLSAIPLLGPLAVALGVGSAQLASAYAAALTAGMALTVISACKLGNEALTLFFDMRQASLAGVSNPAGMIKLYETAIAFGVAVVLAVAVARYDVGLFGLRLEALATGLNDIKESMHWLPDPIARLGGYLAVFAARAQWGYLGVIVGVAYTTEKAFQRASERWLVLGQTVETVEAVFRDTEAALPADAAHGPFVPSSGSDVDPEPTVTDSPAERPTSITDPPIEERTPHVVGAPPRPVVEPVPAPPVPGPLGTSPTPEPHRGPLVRVICGPGETRDVPLPEVEKAPLSYVRDGSGRAWFIRAYYDQLHGDVTLVDKLAVGHTDAENVETLSYV